MSKIDDILSAKISYQDNTWSEITDVLTIETILERIKSDIYKVQVEKLREALLLGNKEYYDNHKKRLPAVTFSSTFDKKRTKDHLINYNSLLVLDIDKLDEKGMSNVQRILLDDKHVISFWRSPSDRGYKGLMHISYDDDLLHISADYLHKAAFYKISDYFFNKYGVSLDNSGNDITRLCFVSNDENLMLKTEFESFQIDKEGFIAQKKIKQSAEVKLKSLSSRAHLYNSTDKNDPSSRKLMSDIIRFLNNKQLSITYSYEDWCKVAMAISNSFTYDIGLNYFLKLSNRDAEKFNPIKCSNFLQNCYETRNGSVNFSSIVYLANQIGFQTKYQKKGVAKGQD